MKVYKKNLPDGVKKMFALDRGVKVKLINKTLPPYKTIRGIILTEEPLIKTTTSKIKRQEELKTIKWN